MGDSIPTLGWILIIFLVVFIVALNVSLFTGMKKKNDKNGWVAKMRQTGRIIKDPFHNENLKFQELSEKVEELKKQQNQNTSENSSQAGESK